MTDNNSLYQANEDILYIMHNAKTIGWSSLKEQSIQRIIYLSKVLYAFTHSDDNIFDYYHFSVSFYGPYADLIKKSIVYLKSGSYLIIDSDGNLIIDRQSPVADINPTKNNWIRTIILILGKYGETRIFGFTINDPLYKEAVETNQQRELDASSAENKTIKVLNSFQQAFEETIDTSSISKEEYLDLYFEYIFSQIINN